MNNRQELILQVLLNRYIRTGIPISSSMIADQLKISSATIRNEMVNLENEGYIIQPHTSAGRIPTEVAYHWLIKKMQHQRLPKKEQSLLSEEIKTNQANFKKLAKTIADMSGLAVFCVWQDNQDAYCTGIANLLQQPEFAKHDLVCNASAVIDRLDEIVNEVFAEIDADPRALLGSDNPFGNFAGAVVAKYSQAGQTGIIGILGPMRMNYSKALQIVRYLSSQLNK